MGMPRLSLIPQKREFFHLYNLAAANTVAISARLVDLLNRTFVTPFDRDDMYRLSGALDDVCDHVDSAAGKIGGFSVAEIREPALRQARVIHRAAGKLQEAVQQLEGFKDSRRQLHVVTGAVMGAGATRRFSAVRWGIAGNIVVAWLLTLPAAALAAAALYWPVQAIF